jgi:hypothetical protein
MSRVRVRSANVSILRNSDKKTRWLLAKYGLIDKIWRGWEFPGDGTFQCVWRLWIGEGCPLPPQFVGEARFKVYRRLKRALRAGGEPHPECMLVELIAHWPVATQSQRWTMLSRHLGMPTQPSMAKLGELTGVANKETRPMGWAECDELLAELPASKRAAFGAFLAQEREPEIVMPNGRHIARVKKIQNPSVRLLAACLLIAGAGDRKGHSSNNNWVQNCERYDDILPPGELTHRPMEVDAVLHQYQNGELRPTDRPNARQTSVLMYSSALNIATDLLARVLGDDASKVSSLLPAPPLPGSFLGRKSRKMLKKSAQPGRDARVDHVVDVVGRLGQIMVAVENVVHQTEQMMARCLIALETAEADLDAGLRVGFDYEGPVVREDGSLGDVDQVISFRIEREATLLERAHALDPSDVSIRRRMPRDPSRVGRYGEYHTPENWRRLYVVYEGTRPSIAGGECVEPGLADLFRWGMLESRRRHALPIDEERDRLHLKHGLRKPTRSVEGLLCTHRSRRTVANMARTADPAAGAIVVPLLEYYHAMCYARIVVRYGIRWGARFGETMQLRLGGDCFRTHRIAGVEEVYLALKPKGWVEYGKFGIDQGTIDAIRHVKELSHARWFPGVVNEKGEDWLPDTRFGDRSRRDQIPPAPYLFVGPNGAVPNDVLSFYVEVLLYRVVKVGESGARHGDRYVFATMLGLDGVGYETLGHLLHHRPGSAMAKHYDLSAHVVAADAARAFNAREDAALLGRISDG